MANAVTVSRVIDASIDRVFQAWTDPKEMKQWYSPVGMTTPEASSEGRKGGKWSVQMKGDKELYNVSGEYTEFDPPNRIVFTWNGHAGPPSTVTVDFKEVDGGTEVTLNHVGLKEEASRAQHEEGWKGTFGKLEEHFS